MNKPLDELYLEWLYGQVASLRVRSINRTYWSLLRQLYSKEFVWIIPNDDNRVEDGRDLRYEFIEEADIDIDDQNWLNMGCSMLEMLIGLSRRLAFEAEHDPRYWFWELLKNLEIDRYTDFKYDREIERVVNWKLDDVIWRTYGWGGEGGLFPLKNPHRDQRDIEILYQMSAYILELME